MADKEVQPLMEYAKADN